MSCNSGPFKAVVKSRSRLTRNRVDELALAKKVSMVARLNNEWYVGTACGGQISTRQKLSSGKAPLTEVALALSDPQGLTLIVVDYCEGVSVTPRKIAAISMLWYAGAARMLDVFDKRVKSTDRIEKGWEALRNLHGQHFTPLERLASAGDVTYET